MEDQSPSATIRISRDGDRDIKMRGLDVFLDDQFVQEMEFGTEFTQSVSPGEHVVRITNRLYSAKLNVTTKVGETAHIQVGNYFGLSGLILITIFGVGHYKVFIREVTDKAA
jgi:hypothetical protein